MAAMTPTVLFVCSGNTCRSPMAEGLFNQYCSTHGESYHGVSAGIYASTGAPMTPAAMEQMQLRGIDMQSFRSQRITRELIQQADYVLTMTETHHRILVELFPDESEKMMVLGDFSGGGDIYDPFGGSTATYAKCAHLIEQSIASLFTYLL